MNLGAVAIRIRAANTRFGNRVAGAAELVTAQEYTLKEESAFVIPLSEQTDPNRNDTAVIQKVRETFGVVCGIKNDTAITDKLGFTAFNGTHESVRGELFRAVLGWLMPGAAELTYYSGGRLVNMDPAWLWYLYEFTTVTIIDSQAYEATLSPGDDFLRLYAQWLATPSTQGVLPITGAEPLLPESLQAPDMTTYIDFGMP